MGSADLQQRCGGESELVDVLRECRPIAFRLRLARKAAGLSRCAMATALKISRRRYAEMEVTGAIPDSLLAAICVITRCSATYLLDGKLFIPHREIYIQHDNIAGRLNLCGGPCSVGGYWCVAQCVGD